jgi:hypothetical protein
MAVVADFIFELLNLLLELQNLLVFLDADCVHRLNQLIGLSEFGR